MPSASSRERSAMSRIGRLPIVPVLIFSVAPQFWIRDGRRLRLVRTGRHRTISAPRTPAGRVPGHRIVVGFGCERPRATEPRAIPRVRHPTGHHRDRGEGDRQPSSGRPTRPAGDNPLMFWLAIAGGVFLVWLVLVFLFTPGIQLPPLAAHVGQRRRLPLHAPVHLSGGAASRQPHHDPHRRSGVLPGDARGDSRRDALDQHGVLHLPARQGRPSSSSTR